MDTWTERMTAPMRGALERHELVCSLFETGLATIASLEWLLDRVADDTRGQPCR